ncbi:Histidine phosphatase superfamily, clade-1 [Cordyceps fumosorosea ARSEF 2679]|uniref:Histidine phosphatase superfamily, clade-1 n=1 Tax=Cordyceps fumosorosea (strain ARSEF 2679) TaxID=1081104 RepID=A0A168BBQ7_CORFA|nr:Histidine phosphatase superfamily, clade-1 [Cordyceps fumosorosea ARSEF 2679]OAA69898.1 Histidine phosphatase superfamily, clade-1 [Cordyceps fumosorosea ARSEF 2679]
MRLFLIRHGETVDNVAGVLAGITDSRLTLHGTVQAGMLASHLAARFPSTPVRKIFTSDLQRALLTGRAVQSMLLPELTKWGARADDLVIVVAHGLLLQPLYACLIERVPWGRLTVDRGIAPHPPMGFGPALRPHWANTAYLEAMVVLDPVVGGGGLRMHVIRVNCTVHISELKRTRGGIGRAAHDDRQRTLDSYFGRGKA